GLFGWISEELQDAPPQAVGAQFVLLDAVEQPRLIARATHRDVEALLVHRGRQGLLPRVRGGNHAEEHYVALVPLEYVWVPAPNPPSVEHVRADPFKEELLDPSTLHIS